jgi:hypothetical protein
VASQASTTDLIVEFGRELRRGRDELSRQLSCAIEARVPQLCTKPELARLCEASICANLEALASAFEYGVQAEDTRPYLPREYARRLAWSAVEPNTISRAHNLRQEWLFDQAQEFTRGRCADPGQAVELLGELGRLLHRFGDAVTGSVMAEFDAERAVIAQGPAAERAHLVDEILAGIPFDVDAVERRLGYRLARTHMALRIWADHGAATPSGQRVLRESAVRLGSLLGTQAPLMVDDGPVLSVWIPLPDGNQPTRIDGAFGSAVQGRSWVRAAVGNPGTGVEGFRQTRCQADRAYVVATTGCNSGSQMVSYRDVGVVSLLANDLDAARRFVAEELGALADQDAASAELRATLMMFLRHGSRYAETAKALYLHRNTVAERIKRAESLLPFPLAARRLEIENALVLFEFMFNKPPLRG